MTTQRGDAISVGPRTADRSAGPHSEAQIAQRQRRRLKLNRKLITGATCLGIVLVLIGIGPSVYGVDPNEQDLLRRLTPPLTDGYPLGTDGLGRDILARTLAGGRVSITVGAGSILVAGFIGTLFGVLAGYYMGRTDAIIARLVDLQLAFPFVLLALLVISLFGRSLPNLIFVLAFSGWVVYARTTRSTVLRLRNLEFVEAAHASGARNFEIMFRHITPGIVPLMIVISTVQIGAMILAESAISFLGLGVQPPTPSWGYMLFEGKQFLVSGQWWTTVFPGAAIMVTVLSINLLGDGLREFVDPHRDG